MKKYIDELKMLILTYKPSWPRMLKNPKYLHIYTDMLKNIPIIFKDTKISTSTLAWCYLHEDSINMKWPICQICNKPLTNIYASVHSGFNHTCDDKKCRLKYRSLQQKRMLFEKYGVENVSQLKSVREKIRLTSLKKYGTTTPNSFGSKQYKDAVFSKYGVENPMKLEAVRNKIKQTNLDRYGSECTFSSQTVKEKIKSTCLKKYGVENGGGSKNAIEKIKQTRAQHRIDDPEFEKKALAKRKKTVLKKYGCDSVMKSDAVKQKLMQNNIQKFGCSNPTTLKSYQFLQNNPEFVPLFSLHEYDIADPDDDLKFRCSHCGQEFTSKRKWGNRVRCYSCFPKLSQWSIGEKEVSDFVHSLLKDETILDNDRTILDPLELDVYIPEKKLAIEYDGLYWHSDDFGKRPNYHLNKTVGCEKHGIQLIHVFENEWVLKKDITKSRIKSILGIYDQIEYARKCTVKHVSSSQTAEFLDKNHLQGAAKSASNIGLFNKSNELIALMTFGKSRFDKVHEWEMVRFCTKTGMHVVGAAGKLLKAFEREFSPHSIVTYADRRWSTGKLYQTLGFSLNHISPPNYWYFKDASQLESRLKYQKHRLSKLLKTYDPEKTEVENMISNGYMRIFDCGNYVYEKMYS